MLRKQEKLKNMILQQAAEYKETKRIREIERAAAELEQPKAKVKGSPKKSKKQAKSVEQKDQLMVQAYGGQPLIVPTDQPPSDPLSDDDKAEERKQKEMMKKYYRNRYTSFLQALVAKKVGEE